MISALRPPSLAESIFLLFSLFLIRNGLVYLWSLQPKSWKQCSSILFTSNQQKHRIGDATLSASRQLQLARAGLQRHNNKQVTWLVWQLFCCLCIYSCTTNDHSDTKHCHQHQQKIYSSKQIKSIAHDLCCGYSGSIRSELDSLHQYCDSHWNVN